MSVTESRIPYHMQKSKIFWRIVETSNGTRVSPPFIKTSVEKLGQYGDNFGDLKRYQGNTLKAHVQKAATLEKDFKTEVRNIKAELIKAVQNETEIPGGRVSEKDRQMAADLASLKGRIRSSSGSVDYDTVVEYRPGETSLPSAKKLAATHVNEHIREAIAAKKKAEDGIKQDLRKRIKLGGKGAITSSKNIVRSIPVKVSPLPTPRENFLKKTMVGKPFSTAPYHVSEIVREYNIGLGSMANNEMKRLVKKAAVADTSHALSRAGVSGEAYFIDASGNFVSINERQRRVYKY